MLPAALREQIGTKGFRVLQRLQESAVWRDLIFAPVREQGPRLLHGDLWLGNMAVDPKRRSYVVGPASWFGPADFDLAVGATFGMPARFLQVCLVSTPLSRARSLALSLSLSLARAGAPGRSATDPNDWFYC